MIDEYERLTGRERGKRQGKGEANSRKVKKIKSNNAKCHIFILQISINADLIVTSNPH